MILTMSSKCHLLSHVHFRSNFCFFCTDGILCPLSRNLERIVSILSTKYIEKWSQSDFTYVNSGIGGGRILCRMLLMEFHRREGLSEFFEITSAKYFDLAFVIILLHRWHWWFVTRTHSLFPESSTELVVFWVFALTGACLSKILLGQVKLFLGS